MLPLYAFLNIKEKQEVGSLAVEHCTAIAAKCWQKSKGEQSYRASAVIYTYRFTSWVVVLKRPSGRSVKRLLWSHLEKQKPNSSARLCMYSIHSQRPDWYERSVCYTLTYNTQGAWACRTSPVMETKSLIITLWYHMVSWPISLPA